MTLTEKAICETYTGVVFCVGNERGAVYQYAEHLMGKPVFTHEFPALEQTLKTKSKDDFVAVCRGEETSWKYQP